MMNSRELFAQVLPSSAYDKLFYQKRLYDFIDTFSTNSLSQHLEDPMSAYLKTAMDDISIQHLVKECKAGPRVFVDTLMDFVSQYLQKTHYYQQRWGAEEREIKAAKDWSEEKIRCSWRQLLEEIEQKYGKQGFSKRFYAQQFEQAEAEEGLWLNLLQEWQKHFDNRLNLQKQQFIQDRGKVQLQLLVNNLKGASQHIIAKSITENAFNQTWALMGGHWNTLVFERLYHTTLLQQRHPVLKTIAERMGRKADKNGTQRIATTSGCCEKMEHHSKSDIAGISMGKNLSALLPSEMALFMDESTEDIFFHKYVSNRLQIFEHQSKMLHAARSLQTHSAESRGPIVVCVDTSGSMSGEPSQIAFSLMMQLSEMSEKECRPCYLIAFSVHARAIDVLFDRTQLLQFFTRPVQGDTDARSMLDNLFELLRSNTRYSHADILWVTDFRIPIPPISYLQRMEQLRQSGTRFYGLQIGRAENRWLKYFDEIFSITEVHTAVL